MWSKKRSAGKPEQLRLEYPVVYLDENLCNCKPILEALTRCGLQYERHLDHFPPGTLDTKWLPLVGKRGWVLVTADKRLRFNELEKRALEKFRVRAFEFPSGQMGALDMAKALETAVPRLISFCQSNEGPFVASITRSGMVHLRWSPQGARAKR